MFTLRIETDNAAFSEDNGEPSADAMAAEIARILNETAKAVLQSFVGIPCGETGVYDVNGNRVGSWKITS